MTDVSSYATASTTPGNNTSIKSVGIIGSSLLSTADDSFRNSMALAAQFYSDITAQDTVGGTGDTITVTTPTLYTAYAPIRLLFTASAANTTATTLNLDGLGAKAVRKISGGTDVALVAGDIPAGARVDVVYSAAANSAAGGWIILGSAQTAFATNAQAATATSTAVALTPANLAQERGFSNSSLINFAIGVPTVNAGALTIPFTALDGTNHAAADPGYVAFRSATAGSGAIAQLPLTSAQSLVVPSGASFGSVSTIATTYVLAAFNNAGAIIYGIINPTSLPIVDGIATTTLLAAGSTSAGVWYTTTALTSKAYTVIGYITATEATAGTWATAPSVTKVDAAAAVNNALPIGICRAWVNLNGTGTIAIRASMNVSSITDNGAGDYTVNFTTPMPDANYATVLGGNTMSGGTNIVVAALAPYNSSTPSPATTSGIRVYGSNTGSTGGPGADLPFLNVAVFR